MHQKHANPVNKTEATCKYFTSMQENEFLRHTAKKESITKQIIDTNFTAFVT